MGEIVQFHARASAGSSTDGCKAANASKVISLRPSSPASRTTSDQRRGGMPRLRQVLTVESGTPSAEETAPVPPNASIVASAVSDMGPNIVRSLRTSQGFASSEPTFPGVCGSLVRMAEGLKDIASRLLRLRAALDYENQAEFCREIGVEKNVYNPFEKGRRRLTIDVALKIRRRFGIPLDWLYSGDPAALPANIYRKLGREAA